MEGLGWQLPTGRNGPHGLAVIPCKDIRRPDATLVPHQVHCAQQLAQVLTESQRQAVQSIVPWVLRPRLVDCARCTPARSENARSMIVAEHTNNTKERDS